MNSREGIDWADIDWVDNAECLDLIEKVSAEIWVREEVGGRKKCHQGHACIEQPSRQRLIFLQVVMHMRDQRSGIKVYFPSSSRNLAFWTC